MLGIVLGTGPSLRESAGGVRRAPGLLFGVNNTFDDFELDVWIACDPQWHREYSPVHLPYTDKWHWDKGICNRYGYKYIEGRWFNGLSTDPSWIAYNHCSSAQALNLAVHYGCDPIVLVGHDFSYEGKRHYFDDLSDTPGEYPENLRKWSTFEGLIETYRHIAEQKGLPRIVNCTPGSKLPWFEFGKLEDFCDSGLYRNR